EGVLLLPGFAVVDALGHPDAPARVDVDVGGVVQLRRLSPELDLQAFGDDQRCAGMGRIAGECGGAEDEEYGEGLPERTTSHPLLIPEKVRPVADKELSVSAGPTIPAIPPAPPPMAAPVLSPEHFQQIADARRRSAKIRRAIAVARFDGWATGIF